MNFSWKALLFLDYYSPSQLKIQSNKYMWRLLIILVAKMEALSVSSHCAKCMAYTISFNHHFNPIRHYSPYFTGKETGVQRS